MWLANPGGVVDARAISGSQRASTTIVVKPNTELDLGSVTITAVPGQQGLTYDNNSVITGSNAVISCNYRGSCVGPAGGRYGSVGALKSSVVWDGVSVINTNPYGIAFWADFVHSHMPFAKFGGTYLSYADTALSLVDPGGATVGWNDFGHLELHYATTGLSLGRYASSNTFAYIASNFGISGDIVAFLAGSGADSIGWIDAEISGTIHFYGESSQHTVNGYLEAATCILESGTSGNFISTTGTAPCVDYSGQPSNRIISRVSSGWNQTGVTTSPPIFGNTGTYPAGACGGLIGSAGCAPIYFNGVLQFIPYW